MEKERTDSIIFVGYTTKRIEEYEALMPEFEAPKSVTKEETRLKKIAEKEEEFAREAHKFVHTGSLHKIVTFDPNHGKDEFHSAADFVDEFNERYGSKFDKEGYPTAGAIRLVGPNIRTFVKMLFAEQADHSEEQLPPAMLQGTHVDLLDLLVPMGFKTTLDATKVAREMYNVESLGEDPYSDARVSALAALAYNLFPHLKRGVHNLFPESEEALC